MRCPNCGAEVSATSGVTYCTGCGYAISGNNGGLVREGGSGRGPDSDHVSLSLDATGIPVAGVRMTVGGDYQEGLSGKTYVFWVSRGRHGVTVSLGDNYKPFEGEIDVYGDVSYKIEIKGEARPSLKVLPRVALTPMAAGSAEVSSVPVNVRIELSDPPRSGHVPASVTVGDQYKEAYTGETLLFTVQSGTHTVKVEYGEGLASFEGYVRIDRDAVFVAKVADLKSVLMRTKPRIDLSCVDGTSL